MRDLLIAQIPPGVEQENVAIARGKLPERRSEHRGRRPRVKSIVHFINTGTGIEASSGAGVGSQPPLFRRRW